MQVQSALQKINTTDITTIIIDSGLTKDMKLKSSLHKTTYYTTGEVGVECL